MQAPFKKTVWEVNRKPEVSPIRQIKGMGGKMPPFPTIQQTESRFCSLAAFAAGGALNEGRIHIGLPEVFLPLCEP